MAYDPLGPSNIGPDYMRALDTLAGTQASHTVPLADYINPVKTLRDEFAIAALPITLEGQEHHVMQAVESAYLIADAMLEYRLKEKL